ncbi:RNA methyltransferase [Cyanobium sp. ATX 6E8]|uniref:RNA methyltransferase n=1 Tax=Cyanobium sp. ATX 6E8 TaxID=2823701 RepID=UPI0020CCA2B5|nr:RNA methyltransferase [Cyanobium sp. ATX 6E8]
MALPEQLLLSELLRRRVRCDQGLDHGAGLQVWMHPPVHRVLGWVSKPSAFGARRLVWRLNQLRGLTDLEVLVQGEPAETDQDVVERLPNLIEAVVLDRRQQPIGSLADAAIELRTGRIRHYLVSRSDPRLPGSSRWRLSLDRLVDQQPGQVFTALESLDDLPLARASVRQEFLRRSRRWRDQMQEAGSRVEERLEGWLEEPPWNEPLDDSSQADAWEEEEEAFLRDSSDQRLESEIWDGWSDPDAPADRGWPTELDDSRDPWV